MANKVFQKKVLKNMEKPRFQRRSCRVVKHFEPPVNLANLHATIPFVNVDSEDDPQTTLSPLKRQAPITNASRNPSSSLPENKLLRPFKLELPKSHVPTFKSSSSSSLESKVEKFTNRSKAKPAQSKRAPKAIKSAREQGSVPSNGASLKSVTDPALIQRELNLKALKQEILDNRRITNVQREPASEWNISSPRTEGLKSEILRSRTDKVVQKKVLITELRSEIAHYKQFSKFQVYSNYEAERKENSNTSGSKRVCVEKLGSSPGAPRRSSSPADQQSNVDSPEGSRRSTSTADSGPGQWTDDDGIIRNKIHEANQLIDRVKRALGKIKCRKTCEALESNAEAKSSSTDIEETINTLKKETEQLITGDVEGDELVEDPLKAPFICPTEVGETKKKIVNVDAAEEAGTPPILNGLASKYCAKNRTRIGNIDFQRPKTRRNEADDDVVRCDKFCTRPEMGHLQVTSSFEELQEKLETISESTESTPSCKQAAPIQHEDLHLELQNKCCNTELLSSENKDVQVRPQTKTTGMCCTCARENKGLQIGVAMKSVAVETAPKEVKNWTSEFLPIVEILPVQRENVCNKCKTTLQEENLPALSIAPKSKLQKLTIQVLPPIIIKEALTLKEVLNLSISPNGRSINQVPNSENVAYIATTFNDIRVSFSRRPGDDAQCKSEEDEDVDENLQVEVADVSLKTDEDDDHIEAALSVTNELLPYPSSEKGALSRGETFLEDIDDYDRFVSRSQVEPPGNVDDILAGLAKSQNLSPELEEQLRNRLLWYKSYHIYDNPNKHDPEPLDKKSLEKISQIDLQFYKTFINPNPTMSEELFTPRDSTHQYMGFESKMVQCNESMLVDEQQSPRIRLRSEVKASLLANRENEPEESTVTIVRLKGAELEEPHKGPKLMQSNYVMRGSYPESDSSPSEITVTISYTASSEERANSQDTVKSMSELHETEVKTIELEDCQELPIDQTRPGTEDRVISLKDKEVISKLRDKLKCVDTTSSQPTYTLKKQSADGETVDHFLKGLTTFNEIKESSKRHSIDSQSKDSQKPPHTVNYMLARHLELGRNGRYRDEEDLFAQVPHPKISSSFKSGNSADPAAFDRDLEVARDKFEVVPRHRLRRYSPDTSNSDTVTTNSVSEGEILCKHSISNGEIHACRLRPHHPRLQRTILTKKHFSLPLNHHGTPYTVFNGASRKFDLADPKITIEKRRNYFNNWVTYYVKPQDVHESTASSCSNNK